MNKKTKSSGRLQREAIEKIASLADRYIGIVTGLIAIVFVGVSIKDIPFDEAITYANPNYLQDIILSVYILCWAFGTKLDTSNQKAVYQADPKEGEIRKGSVAAVLALAAVSITLLLVRRYDLWFAIVLFVFTSVDVGTWLYLRHKFLPEIIAETKKQYKYGRDFFGLYRLQAVELQVLGGWKWRRQVFLYLITTFMVLSAAVPAVKQGAALGIQKLLSISPYPVDANAIALLMPDLLLLLFVAVSEIWHWLYRLRTFWVIRVVSNLERQGYELRRHSQSQT